MQASTLRSRQQAPDPRGSVPSVERLASAARAGVLEDPSRVVAVAREVVAAERARVVEGLQPRPFGDLSAEVRARLDAARLRLPAVLNATGVVLHTNLGRAPWSRAATKAAIAAASGYILLEMDARSGRRAPRLPIVEQLLRELTDAQAALVTNNNAAALVLAVRLAGRGGGVAVARGELIEIGGGVRIPEIVKRAGARLIEVGTTNRTRAADFDEALRVSGAKLILRVHASNFRMEGQSVPVHSCAVCR